MYEVAIIAKDGRILRRYELSDERPTLIGRGRDCEIQIAVATVSRHHARVIPAPGEGFLFQDLASTHGCWVSDQRVREISVCNGLEVRVGPAILRFESLAGRIGAALNASFDDDEPANPLDDTMI